MVTKESVKAEIDKVPDELLDELYGLVKGFTRASESGAQPSIWDKLLQIKFDGPVDFSENLDLYLSGEKRVE